MAQKKRKIKSPQIDLGTKTANIYSGKNFSFYSMLLGQQERMVIGANFQTANMLKCFY